MNGGKQAQFVLLAVEVVGLIGTRKRAISYSN